jgi:branched-chain amino acid transport system ATP-binding protein
VNTRRTSALAEVFTRGKADPARPLLELSGVDVRFGGLAALSDVSFEVGATDLVALIGPNGAGKSTTLNAVSGLIRATGDITFAGQRITALPPARVAAAGIGRSFQDAPLIDRYTVLENVLCGAHGTLGYRLVDQVFRRGKVARRESLAERRAKILLEFVDLSAEAGTEAGSLSYGARKRVDLARAMVSGPRLLLFDEPSSGLDSHERAALQAILVALRAEDQVAVVFVEHHMDLVRATATKVVALKAGEVLMSGTPSGVLDSSEFKVAIMGALPASVSDSCHDLIGRS